MAAYIIADVDVTDDDAYSTYRTQVPPLVEQYGGRFLIRGGKAEVLEGDWQPSRLVVIAFDDLAAARRFYESKEYQGIIGIRQQASTGRLILIEGYQGLDWEPPV